MDTAVIKIQVIDQGIGISEDDLKNLFTPFFQTKDQTSKLLNSNSHGLGLSICQQIANGLGGSLTCKSELDKGSTFTLEFEEKYVMVRLQIEPESVVSQKNI